MYRATREFIKARQVYAEDKLEVVKVQQTGTRETNRCFENAVSEAEENRPAVQIVSGWVVDTFNKGMNGSAITQHYWNYNIHEDKYYDTTLEGKTQLEYVTDSDIQVFAQEIMDELDSCVAMSVFWGKNGEYYGVHTDWMDRKQQLDNLSNEELFKLNKNVGHK